MRQLFFALGIFGIALSVGCGSGNHGHIVVPKGNFSNSSLSGSYVYQITGRDFTTSNGPPYRESGVFTADGNGHITTGTDDFVEGTGGPTKTGITGTYSIGNDGIGTVSLSNGVKFSITLVSSSKAYLIEADAGLNASGLVEKQDTTAITSIPSGTFAFHIHTLNASSLPSARVGMMTVTSGSVSEGHEDLNNNGTFTTQLTITSGSFTTPVAGRGDANLDDGPLGSGSVNFKYYIVDANNIRFLASDSGFVGSGSAEKQNGALTLSGSYAFGSKGDTKAFGIGGVNTVGRFTSDGANAITSGVMDSVQDGDQTLAGNFSGSFSSVDIRGRTVLTLSGFTSVTEVVYVVSPSRGFFLINDPNKVEDGTLDLQQTSSFSNSTLSGQFAFVNDGFDTSPDFIDRVGTMNWDGNGNMTFYEAVNSGLSGTRLLGFFSASYSVASNGRATATISNVSLTNNDFVFYLVSGNDAYILENDTGVEISGVASKQR
ncbi:MAG TPA: hypothetical protein VGV15_09905, partial [Terriglobales bacterium]|nr:hypothetical protein [Terriglobales bacterium]